MKILFLAANPKNTACLRLDQEVREILEGLRRSQRRDQFDLEQRWAVRTGDIQRALLDVKPQIVHFSGHGVASKVYDQQPCFAYATQRTISPHPESSELREGLFFEDEIGYPVLVSANALANLFKLMTAHVKCVVLNGCHSIAQAEAIAQHIPYVIGMNQAIGDKAAIRFAIGFYDALGAGHSIDYAYELGCNAIQLAGVSGHLTPTLLRKPSPSATKPDEQEYLNQNLILEFPSGGPVPLESPFYIERFQNESSRYQAINNSGCLLRITAPDLMGKTSLMARILNYATQQNYSKTYLNLRDAEKEVLTDLNSFLHWFCERISLDLGLQNQLNDYWQNGTLGYIAKCKDFFERYVLNQLNQPLVLGLDELDRLFPYPDIASDFFGMLRNWFERGRDHYRWKQLRLVLAYSTEDYSQFRLNQSPFNVGEPLKLKELSTAQVQELAGRHGLHWRQEQIDRLMAMVGGHPYLLRLAMYYICDQQITLEQLLQEAPSEDGIYSEHLRRYWKTLQQDPQLAEAVRKVMTANAPVQVERSQAYQLRSMGLVQYAQQGKAVFPSCNLYQLYFSR